MKNMNIKILLLLFLGIAQIASPQATLSEACKNLSGAFKELEIHDIYWQGHWFKDTARARMLLARAAFENPCCTFELYSDYFAKSKQYTGRCLRFGRAEPGCPLEQQTGDTFMASAWSDLNKRLANDITYRVLKALCENSYNFRTAALNSGALKAWSEDMIYWGPITDDPARRGMLIRNLENENIDSAILAHAIFHNIAPADVGVDGKDPDAQHGKSLIARRAR